MSRITTLTLAGLTAASLTVTAVSPAQTAPLPAMSAAQVAGSPSVETVGWRRGYYGGYYGPRYGYGYGYRRRNVAGALFAGAALGLIGGAIAASAAPATTAIPPMAVTTATASPSAITAATATRFMAAITATALTAGSRLLHP